ncbi:MAG: coproporphyrinogen dehydrogenase HemZ [Solirubrobacterales bacterium]
MLISILASPGFDPAAHEMIRLFFPESQIKYEPVPADLTVTIIAAEGMTEAFIKLAGALELDRRVPLEPGRSLIEMKRDLRIALYDDLLRLTGKNPTAYGVLTGVRPTKLVHRLADEGMTWDQIEDELTGYFRVNPERARLLITVAANNRPFLPEADRSSRMAALYIGIPYCPSRCHYCSFPGYPLRYRPDLDAFFEGLMQESVRVGQALAASPLRVEMLYIGGGTPSVLSDAQWERLFEAIHRYYPGPAGREFTVEAGRPDTIHQGLLRRLAGGAVNRISINPQSMHAETLTAIGRQHSPDQVRSAVRLAREAGFDNINMDMILGLPGENEPVFLSSLSEVIALKPEGITVHSLARKRGAQWTIRGIDPYEAPEQSGRIGGHHQALLDAGFQPYYLYRQKYSAGNGENIGYAIPGRFSRYNIGMMEERLNIVGLGGGASIKYLNQGEPALDVWHNPADPVYYLRNLENYINRQVDKLMGLT